jgi:protein-disulfide isomerase
MDRRTFLSRAAVAAGGVALGGCLELGTSSEPGTGTDPLDDVKVTEDETPSSERGAFGGHAAAQAIGEQPFRGPEPGSAKGTIVAFEDPSCTRCATFERETVPKIQSELVEPGKATFVFRGYPVVYPWGEPGTQALEAALARSEGAHWALAEHYFAEQDAFSTDNVYERTETFLAAETDVDAAGVVEDARENAYDDRVQVDLDAGKAAGAGSITPTVFLFRDGEFRTKARGSVSFSVVESALGV